MNIQQKEKSRQSLKIFLSYSQKDKEYAQKLRKILSIYSNIRHIFTPEMLSAGENWLPRLKDEISQCDIFVVLLSPDSVQSEWVLSELGAAWALNKLIIPVITQNAVLSEIPIYLGDTKSLEIKYLEEHPEALDNIIESYDEKAS